MNDLDDLLAEAREMAAESKAERLTMGRTAPPCRLVASDMDTALAAANRLQQPVDVSGYSNPITLWPIGQTPPIDQGRKEG